MSNQRVNYNSNSSPMKWSTASSSSREREEGIAALVYFSMDVPIVRLRHRERRRSGRYREEEGDDIQREDDFEDSVGSGNQDRACPVHLVGFEVVKRITLASKQVNQELMKNDLNHYVTPGTATFFVAIIVNNMATYINQGDSQKGCTDDVVYIGTTTHKSSQKDDVVYIGTTTPQSSQKKPDEVIYVGTTTPKSSLKRKAYDHAPSNTRIKKSRFDDNCPNRTTFNITSSQHQSQSNQREDELEESSNYKKRKKPDDNDGNIKSLLPPTPLLPPPSFDSIMSQLTMPPPILSRNINLEDSKPKRFKSSSNGKECKFQLPLGYNENAAKLQPPPKFDENTGKISQFECKTNAVNTSLHNDFKKQPEKLGNLGNIKGSGSYINSRFSKDTESYQHLPCSRKDLSETISSKNQQLSICQNDNSKVPKKSRFSESTDSHTSGNRTSGDSEYNLKNSPLLPVGSDGPIQQVGRNNANCSDTSHNFEGSNNSLNRNSGKFNHYGNQYNNSNSGSYNLSENNGGVAKNGCDNSSLVNNIYSRDPGNTSTIYGFDKDTFKQKENSQHLTRYNRFSGNAKSSGNGYNQNNDTNFRHNFSRNLSLSAKQLGTNRNPGDRNAGAVTNTDNFGNKFNSVNDRQSEKSATNFTKFNELTCFTNSTESKLCNAGLNSDSENSFSVVSKPFLSKIAPLLPKNKGSFGTSGSQQFQNKESFIFTGLQGNARNPNKILNSNSDTSFPRNVVQSLDNTSLNSSKCINQANAYEYNTCNNLQPNYGYSKAFSQFDRNTSFGKISVENTRQAEYRSNTGTPGNNQNPQNDSQLSIVTTSQNISRFQENNGRTNSINNDYNDSNGNNTHLKLPLSDGEKKSLECKENPQRNTVPYPVFSNNNNVQVDNSCTAGNSSEPGYSNGFGNITHSKFQNTDTNWDPTNIQFGMKRRTTGIKTNYRHNNEIDKLFGNRVYSHHEKLGCNTNGNSERATAFVSQLGQNTNLYNINPAPPVQDLTKPPPPLPHLANFATNASANNTNMNSKPFKNRRQNTDQRFENKKRFRENNIGPRQTKGFGRNINGQNGNNNSGTRPSGVNLNVPRPTRQFAGNSGPGMRKGPRKCINQNANRTNINRFNPNTNRNSIHNSTMNNRKNQPTWKNKRHAKEPSKFAKLLELVKTNYAKKPTDSAKKQKRKKLKKLKKSNQKPSDSTNPKSEVDHIDVNKQVFGDFVPIKVGLKKPEKGHLKPKPDIYWKEWWSLYGYVEKDLMPIDANNADIKSALNFVLLPKDVEFRKRKRTLLVMGVAKILRHIKLNESDYALRDIFSVLKYKHQLEDPHFQQHLNAKEKDRVEKVLKHARKKTRRALFYQNMVCRWHFSALLLKRANTGEACLKCGHARKLMNDKAFNYLVWESIQELKKLISEDWPEFEQFYKSF